MTQGGARDGGRLFLEGLVIVGSILVAFGIDAAWAEYQDTREAERLLSAIEADLIATRDEAAARTAREEALATRARTLLGMLAADPRPAALPDSLRTLGNIFVMTDWQPVNHAYNEAVNSGRIRLVRDDTIRLTLARYQEVIDELDRIYQDVRVQYYGQIEPFMVAHTVYSEIAMDDWRGGLVQAPFSTDFEALAGSRELWNLLTLRLELASVVLQRLELVDRRAGLLLERLDGNAPDGSVRDREAR